MRQDKYKYQIGDVLYEASKTYHQVIEHKIIDIWVEDYIGGSKTIFRTESPKWRYEKFFADIKAMFNTREAAEEALEKMEGEDDG